ncbi:uncharacterized protein BCR38DRAFT_354190 [Pseudomassariella vexata]|uniref:Cytochrome P450 n=1 Tax=Pseudomassariella vexata TaxID=1141098 RepID=A0A1Y2DF52_9PEZI|nr:uncharacterized protein BCR38DRAFT_354190 [Pseudomassariella vexata]ORY57888.1 hypothetical protein BCR38DRAFT_354190 [Pseudomassariella vexata]
MAENDRLDENCLSRARILQHRSIADFSYFGAKTLRDRLQLRAAPNARLITAFGINNSFTTVDEKLHEEFIHTARLSINSVDNRKWAKLSERAAFALNTYILYSNANRGNWKDAGLPLAEAIRVVSLDVVLELLYPTNRGRLSVVDAITVTSSINTLWVESKVHENTPETEASKRTKAQLHKSLACLLAVRQLSGSDANPLNLIMPAYETLWRVILSTYIHVALLSGGEVREETLDELVEIVPLYLGTSLDLEGPVVAFGKEALRLYAPTKRIYRGKSEHEVVAADVEALHHDLLIWGPDALEFNPGRFKDIKRLTKQQRDAYMPFGIGTHRCPAAHGFGERMISLLVVVLFRRLGSKDMGLQIDFGDSEQQDRGMPLPTGRLDMETWAVKGQ